MKDQLALALTRLDEVMQELVRRLHQELWREIPVELTRPQFLVCSKLLERGRMTVTEIAAAMGVSPSAITTTVDRLSDSGLVARDRGQEDRRVVHLSLTAAGEEATRQAKAIRDSLLRRYFEQLPVEDVASMVRICDALLGILKQDEAETT
ncbi:MAG TPA: MarR family transcriptional regulator [Desulfotomaculum sp.]|nr:MarR family transcriptional regulator [Desulfotomaculum sp.]